MGEFLSDPSPAAPPHMPELVRRRDRRYQRFAAEELERFRNDDFNDGAGYDCLSHDIPRPAIDCGQSDPWLFQMSRAQKPLANRIDLNQFSDGLDMQPDFCTKR
jgi:hypothetical protein